MKHITKKILVAGSTVLLATSLATQVLAQSTTTDIFLTNATNASGTSATTTTGSTSSSTTNTSSSTSSNSSSTNQGGTTATTTTGTTSGSSTQIGSSSMSTSTNDFFRNFGLSWLTNIFGFASTTLSASSTGLSASSTDQIKMNFWTLLMNFFSSFGTNVGTSTATSTDTSTTTSTGTSTTITGTGTSSMSTSTNTTSSSSFSDITVSRLSSTSGTIGWAARPGFSNITAYYSTVNPVIIGATTTLQATPGAFLRRNQIMLHGLRRGTTYYYILVAHTGNGTTTSAQGSFMTQGR